LKYDPPRAFRRRFLTPAQEKQWKQVDQNAWKYLSGQVEMTDDDWDILNGLYNAELAYLDTRIGQIYDFLRQEGLLDDTIIIITSDHGENLSEHGMMDHQYCVYDTLAKVPLIIRYPDHFAAGSWETALVQTIDLFPTLAKILGVTDDPALESIQGQSLLAEDLQENDREFAIIEYLAPQLHSFRRESLTFDSKFSRQLRAIRTQTHKYIWASDGNCELYHLQTDPGEMKNVIDDDPETAVTLAQQLEQWVSKYELRQPEDMSIDESVVNRLEALGYI
ncbi:MAG: sulfatase-like hydrolase/transferase, partial [Chloroflexi bacterium]|nr:sulfatase-like hydrolase/transferase [Chloroflexota bacterium]